MIIDDQHYDVIVIGSGAGGGTLVGQLAASGRRVLLLVFIAGWFTWELLYTKDQMWVLVTVLMFAYAVWYFFINFEKALKKAKDDAKPQA